MPKLYKVNYGKPDPSLQEPFERLGEALSRERQNRREDERDAQDAEAHELDMRARRFDFERAQFDRDLDEEKARRERVRFEDERQRATLGLRQDELTLRGKVLDLEERIGGADELRTFAASLSDLDPGMRLAAAQDLDTAAAMKNPAERRQFLMQRSMALHAASLEMKKRAVGARIEGLASRGGYGDSETNPDAPQIQSEIQQIQQALASGEMSPEDASQAEQALRQRYAARAAIRAEKQSKLLGAQKMAETFEAQGMGKLAEVARTLEAQLAFEVGSGSVGESKALEVMLADALEDKRKGEAEMAKAMYLNSERGPLERMKAYSALARALERDPTIEEFEQFMATAGAQSQGGAGGGAAAGQGAGAPQGAAPGGLRPIAGQVLENILSLIPTADRNAPAPEPKAAPKAPIRLSKEARRQRR